MKPALCVLAMLLAACLWADEKPATPTKAISLLPATDLSAFESWLKGAGTNDARGVFKLRDGVLHISGEDRGYLATRQAFQNFHLTVEFKWGNRTDGGPYVRNSGVLLHGTGAHGGAGGTWMTSLEVQLAQGCEGDLIVIGGKDTQGRTIPATMTSRVRVAADKRTRWDAAGETVKYSGRQFWWNGHQPFFKELLDTRGAEDVGSPLGEWTRVECLCRGDRVTIKINGRTVNEAHGVFPAAGRVLLQNEGHEVYFRNLTIQPLQPLEAP